MSYTKSDSEIPIVGIIVQVVSDKDPISLIDVEKGQFVPLNII
jgi:hypothetical protein